MNNDDNAIKILSHNSSPFLCYPLLLFQQFQAVCEIGETVAAKERVKAIIFKWDSADIR